MPSPGPPDIVARRLKRLTDNDLRFLVENFPEPAASYGDIARIFASLPTTLDSALDAEYVYRKIFENRRELLEICRVGYRDAASTRLARVYKLEDVFLRLALQFDHYRERLTVLAREYLFH